MGKLGHFLSYNNAVPIAISFMLMGAGGVFAATNPEAVYTKSETVISIDNTYIANKDFSSWTPRIEILGVTEDEEDYQVAYRLHTIDIADYVWQDIAKERTLTVSKSFLGDSIDLGVYTTKQLKEVVDAELARLKETQQFERRAISQKTVATEYGGLVGKLLDTSTEMLPGYTPVVAAKPEQVKKVGPTRGQVAGAASEPAQEPSTTESSPSSGAGIGEHPEPPSIQILGPNPHHIPVGVNFADLGVVASDDSGYIPSVEVFVEGELVTGSFVTVDTSVDGEWHIRYKATDNEGNFSTATRLVVVGAGALPQSTPESEPEPEPAPQAESEPEPEQTDPEPEPEPEPTVEPEPEPEPVEEPEPTPEDESSSEESATTDTQDDQTAVPDPAEEPVEETEDPAETPTDESTDQEPSQDAIEPESEVGPSEDVGQEGEDTTEDTEATTVPQQ